MKTRAERNRNRRARKFHWKKLLFLGFIFLLVLWVGSFVFTKPAFWDGKSRVALAIPRASGDVTVAVFDPELESITSINIPGNTQVEVARNLGTWKMGSVEKLAAQEKIGGELISRTVMYSFGFPVEAWAEKEAEGFLGGNLKGITNAVFANYKTNLNAKDRLNLAFFVLSVKNSDRLEVDLAKTSLLYKTKLSSGEEGYKVRGGTNDRILAIFADGQVSEESALIAVSYAQDQFTAKDVGEIIQILGTKVTAIKKEDNEVSFCEVRGKKELTRRKVAQVLGCIESTKETNGNFDIEVVLGKGFQI